MRVIVLIFVSYCIGVTLCSPSCLNGDGVIVDYWAAIKPPKLRDAPIPYNAGIGLISSFPYDITMHRVQATVDRGEGSALEATLSQIYSSIRNGTASRVGWLMYNDDPPKAGRLHPRISEYAHMKGVLMFDEDGGFWLDHSVPLFPPKSSQGYTYPDPQKKKGQSFLCLRLDHKGIHTVLASLFTNRPKLYESHTPDAILNSYSDILPQVASGKYQKMPTGRSDVIQTIGRMDFTVFSKSASWNSFLYADLVAPTLQTDLYVETWTVGPTHLVMPTFCANSTLPYSVMNVTYVNFSGISWKQSVDHSKWAVSNLSHTNGYICIGDINRQFSQNHRGGGTICTNQLPDLTKSFQKSIVSAFNC